MRVIFLRLLIVALWPLALSGSLQAEVKIGVIASLQGGAAEQGKSWLDGATLAVEELNREGIVSKLVVEDDLTQSARAASAFNKLAQIDHVNGIIAGTWDFLGEAVYPLALRNKIFTLTPSNPKENLSLAAKKNPFVTTNGLSLEAEERVIEPFLRSTKKKTIAIVYVQVPFATSHVMMLKQVINRVGLELVGEVEISLDDQLSSFKFAAQRATRKSPDIIYLLADYNGLDLFMAELQNIKSSPIVLTTQHLEGAFQLSNQNQSRYSNCYGVHPKYNSIDFTSHFTKRFGYSPKVFAAEGYDAAQYLVRAFANSPEGPKSPDFSYQGLKGRYQYKTGQNALLEDEAVVVRFENGKLIESPIIP